MHQTQCLSAPVVNERVDGEYRCACTYEKLEGHNPFLDDVRLHLCNVLCEQGASVGVSSLGEVCGFSNLDCSGNTALLISHCQRKRAVPCTYGDTDLPDE